MGRWVVRIWNSFKLLHFQDAWIKSKVFGMQINHPSQKCGFVRHQELKHASRLSGIPYFTTSLRTYAFDQAGGNLDRGFCCHPIEKYAQVKLDHLSKKKKDLKQLPKNPFILTSAFAEAYFELFRGTLHTQDKHPMDLDLTWQSRTRRMRRTTKTTTATTRTRNNHKNKKQQPPWKFFGFTPTTYKNKKQLTTATTPTFSPKMTSLLGLGLFHSGIGLDFDAIFFS